MPLSRRLAVVAGCLTLAVLASLGLQRHLGPASSPYPELRGRLADVPLTLNPEGHVPPSAPPPTWDGVPHPATDAVAEQIPFADEFIFRGYRPRGDGPFVELYMVYSRKGDDRKHHPEICVREASGKPEDVSARATVYLDEEKTRPVQRFRFHTGTGRGTVIYYWHYTLLPEPVQGETFLQALHRRTGRTPPSITVQVSTDAPPEALTAVERSFLPALDAVMKKELLPPRTEVGCDRVPITLIRQ